MKEEKNCENKAGLCIPEEGLHFSECEKYQKQVKEEKNTSWEARLNKQFFGGVPIDEMGSNQIEESELQGFIRQEREALLREVSELIKKKEREIPKAKKGDYDAMLANLNQQHINIGYNQAITEVQEIIKKKI